MRAGPKRLLQDQSACERNGVDQPGERLPSVAGLYGVLFEQVQLRDLFGDGKSFVDAVPLRAVAEIMSDFRSRARWENDELKDFVLANFRLPDDADRQDVLPPATRPIIEHIEALWIALEREPVMPADGSSELQFEGRHVVPGGRFRELYYWDSYFTMLGLQVDDRQDLIEDMLDGFTGLVERHGHIPNGARSYYLSRSQPPFLYLMAGLSSTRDVAIQRRRTEALLSEYRYWMHGGHVVAMPDGSHLNRYWDDCDAPRDESYREDVETAREADRAAPYVYRNLRAAAESGWDFSSRWLADGRLLAAIDTTNVVPADLNALLYGMERVLADRCAVEGRPEAEDFASAAERRRDAVERWLWNGDEGRYGDFDIEKGSIRPGLTAASLYPLFTRLASPARAARVAATVGAYLVAPGGLRTTLSVTGQQWDSPNGWAPLQWIAVEGLGSYGHEDLARKIAARWIETVQREYAASGKLVEKYDVEMIRPGGGGEYPLQDGFGWTNGVTRALIARGYAEPGSLVVDKGEE